MSVGQRRAAIKPPAEEFVSQRSKINNRVAKVYKEDDDLFGHLEKMDDDLPLDEPLRGETVVENFEDLMKEDPTPFEDEEEDRFVKAEEGSTDFLSYYRGSGGPSLSEMRKQRELVVADKPMSTERKRVGFANTTEGSNGDGSDSSSTKPLGGKTSSSDGEPVRQQRTNSA